MKSITTLLIALFLISSVMSCGKKVQTLVDSGDYDQTIELSMRKLVGDKNKSPKYVKALETAFKRANAEDIDRANRMKGSATADWVRIHSIYRKINDRQLNIKPLIPLVDKNGYEADLRFVRVGPMLNEAGNQAAVQLYTEGERLLALGRQGDKAAARQAYESFESIAYYQRDYRNANSLMREAEELGRLYITVEMMNATGGYLPAGFEQELLRINASEMQDRWRIFEAAKKPGRQYDYVARIIMRNIDVSPERSSERQYIDEKEIIDGTEYILDERGNVAKDSLGNDRTKPKKVIIRADVFEVFQNKTAVVSGSFELYDINQRRVVDQGDLTAEAVFENYASTFQGDRRALSSQTRLRIGNRPQQFPSNEELILDAAEVLKPILAERIATSYKLI
ncbi:hypothetical protein [Neolewinella persica]|uniref:hypothetical protein n=1 Tax=Neolewinella persica TaxID=70998 RepID=UPI000382D5F8|nr:hypothetical protein [Neolewinella persica]